MRFQNKIKFFDLGKISVARTLFSLICKKEPNHLSDGAALFNLILNKTAGLPDDQFWWQ